MSKYINKGITVYKPDAMTHGKTGVVESWDKKLRKYKISFDESWCGWYKRRELIFD